MVFGGYLTKEALVGKLCCRDWFFLSLTLTYAAPEDTVGRGVGMVEIPLLATYVEPSGHFISSANVPWTGKRKARIFRCDTFVGSETGMRMKIQEIPLEFES